MMPRWDILVSRFGGCWPFLVLCPLLPRSVRLPFSLQVPRAFRAPLSAEIELLLILLTVRARGASSVDGPRSPPRLGTSEPRFLTSCKVFSTNARGPVQATRRAPGSWKAVESRDPTGCSRQEGREPLDPAAAGPPRVCVQTGLGFRVRKILGVCVGHWFQPAFGLGGFYSHPSGALLAGMGWGTQALPWGPAGLSPPTPGLCSWYPLPFREQG